MASNERLREHTLLGDPEMQAWVERAANRMVGDLLSEGRFDDGPGAAPEDDFAFADRLIRCELALIADGAYPLRVALRIAVLRAAREALLALASIRALPEVGMVPHSGRTSSGTYEGAGMADWSVRGADETYPCCRFASRSRLIVRAPTALGEMRFPAPPTELGSAAARAFSVCARPRITYGRQLEYIGDDRAANNVLTSVAPFVNPTNLLTNR